MPFPLHRSLETIFTLICWTLLLPLPAAALVAGVESKMLALLIHLGKRFCCSRSLAASEHVLLKYLYTFSNAGWLRALDGVCACL